MFKHPLFLTLGAQSEVDYTEQLNFSDDDDQGSNQKEHDGRWYIE